MTGKVRFLIVFSLLVFFAVPSITIFVGKGDSLQVFAAISVVIFSFLILPWIYLTISVLAIKIYELPNRWLTINTARTTLSRNPNLIVVGITGSFGKTTTKEILSTILAKKYKVLSPPQSYNTLFAVAQIIKEQLKEDHEIFLVEMGAYRRGEIAELCRMVKPKIGILTGIANQHLERFGTQENIIKAKYDLIESLPPDGLAVFNLYSKPCCDLYQKTDIAKIGYSRI